MNPTDCPCPYPDVFLRGDPDPVRGILIKKSGARVSTLELNASGKTIWTLCDAVRGRNDILGALRMEFPDVPGARLAHDLDGFIHDLVTRRFLWLRGPMNHPPGPPREEGRRSPGPLFIMGNKRSGSTLLVKLLNLHPNIFLTDESDIAWILYQAISGDLSSLRCYPWDEPLGMKTSLKAIRPILEECLRDNRKKDAAARAFFQAQQRLMDTGLRGQQPQRKARLAWIGDKKPVQHADPKIRSFLQTHLPDARYIHIVRDPRAVVPSMKRAAETWDGFAPRCWSKTPDELLERWAVHEEWALAAGTSGGGPTRTLRLEDLRADPTRRMAELFDFLELETPRGIEAPIRDFVEPDPNRKRAPLPPPASPRVNRLMKIHGYA
ncbi:MAG: PqqD family peptide modification chaperone [Desulfobacterales bacterium]|nr:PqqD family peptide modification chaperone [Desulfobacterales bacterium]